MTLGAVVLDEGDLIIPIDRIYLKDGNVIIDATIPPGRVFDLTVRHPYAVHDPAGRVVYLGSQEPLDRGSNDPDAYRHLSFNLTIDHDRTSSNFRRYHQVAR